MTLNKIIGNATLSTMTITKTTLMIMTLSITIRNAALSLMTLSITTLNTMTYTQHNNVNVTLSIMTLTVLYTVIYVTYAECDKQAYHAECH